MIKVCYIIGQLTRGGAERQLYELVKGIDRKKFYPVVISLSQGGYWSSQIHGLNIQVIELQRKKNREFARLFRLIRLLRKLRPDIVHASVFFANSYGRIAAVIARVPVIIASERSLIEMGKDKTKYRICIDKLLAPFTHGVICNTHKASESLTKKYSYDAKKVFTVHNGINAADFFKEIDLNSQKKIAKKVVGTIGRLYPPKNHRLFLDMARIVLERSEDESIKFMIVGEGILRDELERYSQQLGIKSRIVFTGERSDIPELLEGMDIFVMTSLYEGLSNVIMEAMAAGLPVAAADVGGNSELVINRETGFLCPSNDAFTFAERVISLLKKEADAEQMGKNGRERIIKEFKIEKMIKATEDIYTELLERRMGIHA